MKVGNVRVRLAALAAALLPAGAFDLSALPPRALEHISRTPVVLCLALWTRVEREHMLRNAHGFHWVWNMDLDCAGISYIKLMIDSCIKSKCDEEDRRTVRN
jgi:hypothetical protein